MSSALIAVVTVAAIVGLWFLWRSTRHRATRSTAPDGTSTAIAARPELPAEGLLVPEDVLRSAGSTTAAIWDALEKAAAPVALEYFPVSEADITRYRTVPINAAAQQAMVKVVEAVNPKAPTLFRAVLPKGAELVNAVGTDGFRGFSRTGGQTTHAVLKPVAAGGAIAAGWPVLAVAGTVMAADMVAQREQRAHQRRVETILGRQEERHYVERIKDQRSADAQLSRAISLMLDGRNPDLDLALKSADDEFHRADQFLAKYRGVVDRLVGADGKVDCQRLEEALGGQTKDVNHFVRELHLARAAIAIRRKALVAEAAGVALADPANPYSAMRRFLEAQADQLEQADTAAVELTEQLMRLELKGRWHNRKALVAERQERLRAAISPPAVDGSTEVRYLAMPSGELFQLVPSEDEASLQPASED